MNFITKKTPDQIQAKINDKFATSSTGEFEENYSEALNFYGTRVKAIMDKWPERSGNKYFEAEKLVEELNSYLSSIKKEVTKSIKRHNSLQAEKYSQKSQKSESTKMLESASFLRLLKEEASTKMTEEDRKISQFFIKEDCKSRGKLMKKKTRKAHHRKNEEGNYYDLTIEGIELPQVRQRSNSLHLGKRRFEKLPSLDLLEFGLTKKKKLKVKDDNSVFFMVTNNLFKNGASVKGC